MTRLIICRWCGGAIQPNSTRFRFFWSRSTKAVGRWIAHFHPECGDAILEACDRRELMREGALEEGLPAHFGDPAQPFACFPAAHLSRTEP